MTVSLMVVTMSVRVMMSIAMVVRVVRVMVIMAVVSVMVVVLQRLRIVRRDWGICYRRRRDWERNL